MTFTGMINRFRQKPQKPRSEQEADRFVIRLQGLKPVLVGGRDRTPSPFRSSVQRPAT